MLQPSSGSIDPDMVNVRYTTAGGTPVTLSRVNSKTQCDPSLGGWYYDNSASPKRILMCDVTCTVLKHDAQGRIDILFGCKTKVA